MIHELIYQELEQATAKFGKFHSAHEGFAILNEEYDEMFEELSRMELLIGELWTNVKNNDFPAMEDHAYSIEKQAVQVIREAIQVAAMARRFRRDVCGSSRVESDGKK
jgi:hypothetical protein